MSRRRTEGDGPGWKDLVASDAAGDGGTLLAALLTTYEPPSPDFLVEELLPHWLDLGRAQVEDRFENALFLTELHDALKRMRGRISVVCSPAREPEPAHWLWSLVHRFSVGYAHAAIQHAKLWLHHRSGWTDGDTKHPETLTITISSGNLTRDAFRSQLQAGWRARLPLARRGSDARLRAWGVIPSFLEALGAQSGPAASQAMTYWLKMLSRATPPEDAAFVASVPGVHSKSDLARDRKAWGAAGLRRVAFGGQAVNGVEILVPTVGHWQRPRLLRWCQELGVRPENVALCWAGRQHPWSAWWSIAKGTEVSLRSSGCRILKLPEPQQDGGSPLHEEHRLSDARWSHAKVYWLSRGARARVLVTSANFSAGAWGSRGRDGRLVVENFELGVVITVSSLPLRSLAELDGPVPSSDEFAKLEPPVLAWAEATWDGWHLEIAARSADATIDPTVEIHSARTNEPETRQARWLRNGTRVRARISWEAGAGVPTAVTVRSSGAEAATIAVFDLRSGVELSEEGCPELDPEVATAARALLLEERYGYRSVDGDDLERALRKRKDTSAPSSKQGYALPAYVDLRARMATIDAWTLALRVACGPAARQWVLADGNALATLWARAKAEPGQSTVPQVLASKELGRRVLIARRHA